MYARRRFPRTGTLNSVGIPDRLFAKDAIMPTPSSHPRNPLQGITLERIVTQLVERHGWAEMGRRIPIRCFLNEPSVKSSLTFLRKTPWARKKVEEWFIAEQ